jgi:hypothetical protein
MMFKSMFKSMFAALLATGSLSATFADTEEYMFSSEKGINDVLIFEQRVSMPYGLSTYTDSLRRPSTASKLKLRLSAEPSCPRAPRMNLYVRSTADRQWYLTRFDATDNSVSHGVNSFDAVRFDIDQPYFGVMTCNVMIYASGGNNSNNPVDDSTSQNGQLVGRIVYAGGFDSGIDFAIDPNQKITAFRLAIPQFCKDLEVVEAGTISSNVYDVATLIDRTRQVYRVSGNVIRASALRVALNGPSTMNCEIPVFIYKAN